MAEQAVRLVSGVAAGAATQKAVATPMPDSGLGSGAASVQAKHAEFVRVSHKFLRFGHFVNDREFAAHFELLTLIAARRALPTSHVLRSVGRVVYNARADQKIQSDMESSLWVFKQSPRCNCGRGPLRVKQDGNLRRYSCPCGARFIEVRP